MSEALTNIKAAIANIPPKGYARVRAVDVVALVGELKAATKRSPALLQGAQGALDGVNEDVAEELHVYQTAGHLAEVVAAVEQGD